MCKHASQGHTSSGAWSHRSPRPWRQLQCVRRKTVLDGDIVDVVVFSTRLVMRHAPYWLLGERPALDSPGTGMSLCPTWVRRRDTGCAS
jgi:hypothetical protein